MSGKAFFDDASQFIKSMREVVDRRDASRDSAIDLRDTAVHMMSRYEKKPLNTKLPFSNKK